MHLFESLLVALSTYSALPVPQFEWNERNMRYAICFFPAVGVVCGGALWAWYALAETLQIGSVLFAAVAACLPLLLTGGIHLDGYMDTVDALASHQSRERKLEIMKDPHCGAFAVIYCAVYLLLYFGLIHELYGIRQIPVLCPAFVLSRTLSGLCAVSLPNARKAGMLNAYTQDADKRISAAVLGAAMVVSAAVTIWLSPAAGTGSVSLALLCALLYRRMAMRQFGGVTGDTAGFFLQTCELSCLLGAWIGGVFG